MTTSNTNGEAKIVNMIDMETNEVASSCPWDKCDKITQFIFMKAEKGETGPVVTMDDDTGRMYRFEIEHRGESDAEGGGLE